MSTNTAPQNTETKKILIRVNKYDHHTGDFKLYRQEIIDEKTAAAIIEVCSTRVPVSGFYEYVFTLQGQVYGVHTLNADLVGFITKTKQ